MVKVMEFWKFLCEDLGYRFFSGVPCNGLNPLYNKMSSSFLHYLPAANEQVAVDVVSGSVLTGTKAAALMGSNKVENLDLSFSIQNNISLLLIVSGDSKPKNIYTTEINEDLNGCLVKIDNIVSEGKQVALFIGEDFFK
jgi:sulfopyruvate decarboxylase TPP-binding subunit